MRLEYLSGSQLEWLYCSEWYQNAEHALCPHSKPVAGHYRCGSHSLIPMTRYYHTFFLLPIKRFGRNSQRIFTWKRCDLNHAEIAKSDPAFARRETGATSATIKCPNFGVIALLLRSQDLIP